MERDNINVCRKLLHYDQKIRSIRYHLNAIQTDIELLANGWKINYALDFSVIYKHAFGLMDLIRSTKGDMASEMVEDFIQKSDGIKQLFARNIENERLILLPPYAIELGNFINSYRAKTILTEIQLSKFEDYITSKSPFLNPINKLQSITQNYPEKIPKKNLVKKCLSIILSEFGEIFFLWLFHSEHFSDNLKHSERGMETIKSLFNNGQSRVEFIDKIWPELTDTYKKLTSRYNISSKWHAIFKKVRNRPHSDFIDAQAINLIYHLNPILNKKKEIVLLVSDTPTMSRVLNWDIINPKITSKNKPPRGIYGLPLKTKKADASELRILRTPRTFLFHTLCYEKSPEKYMQNITAWRNYVSRYFTLTSKLVKDIQERCEHFIRPYPPSIIRNCNRECRSCNIFSKGEKLTKILEEDQEINIQFRNIQLFLNTQNEIQSPQEFTSPSNIRDSITRVLIDFIQELGSGYSTFKVELLKKRDELHSKLASVSEKIPSTALNDATLGEVLTFKIAIDDFTDLHDRLDFQDPRITRVFDNIKTLEYQKPDSTKLKTYILELVELTKNGSQDNSEAILLKAAMAYLYKEYSYCLEILAREKNNPQCDNIFGIDYLYCLALFRHGASVGVYQKYRKAIQLSQRLKDRYHENPRSYHLFAFLVLSTEKKFSTQKSPKDIIEELEKGLQYNPSDRLALSMLNNMAFGLYRHLDPNPTNVKRARQIINRMGQVVSEKEWSPNYLHTAGCISMMIAKQSNYFREVEIEIKKAIEYFDRAIKLCNDTGRFKRSMENFSSHRLEAIKFQTQKLQY
jgi:predicted nuclease with TOPRIM domain